MNKNIYDIEEIYYVYFLCFPDTGKPFYVGKGKDSRWKHHLTERKNNTENIYKWNTIQKIRGQNKEPQVFFYATKLDEETAYDIEEELIIIYGRKRYEENGILTNLCIGNRPPVRFGVVPPNKGKTLIESYGFKRAAEIRDQMSFPGETNPFFGRTHTKENKKIFADNASKQWKGYKKSPEHQQRITQSRRNNPAEQERLRNLALKNIRSEKMKAGTRLSNKKRGFEKTKKKVLKSLEKYQKTINMLEQGFNRLEIRDLLNFDRTIIWNIERRLDYFKDIIQDIEKDKTYVRE